MFVLPALFDDFTIALYAERKVDVAKAYIQAQQFCLLKSVKQVLIVQNTEEKKLFDRLVDRKIQVLEMQEKISQGAALNKMLAHLVTKHTLLLDAKGLGAQTLLLDKIFRFSLPSLAKVFVNIPLSSHLHSPYLAYQKKNDWPSRDLYCLSFALWGAVLFENNFVFALGGFDESLSNDALFVDLSMRAHRHQAMIVEPKVEPLSFETTSAHLPEYQFIVDKYFSASQSRWASFLRWFTRRPLTQQASGQLEKNAESISVH